MGDKEDIKRFIHDEIKHMKMERHKNISLERDWWYKGIIDGLRDVLAFIEEELDNGR